MTASGKLGKTYPHLWAVGPDPVKKRLHMDFLRARAQAKYRGEDWLLERDQYIDLWLEDNKYLNKGRSENNLCMVRITPEGAWSLDNVAIISRWEHFKTRTRKKNV